MSEYVFLSYGREDSETAERLRSELLHRGFTVWIDRADLRGGQLWKQALAKAIRGASHFIALMSASSTTRESTATWEMRQAAERQAAMPDDSVFIIPARIDECEPPVEALREPHWIDLFPDWTRGVEEVLLSLSDEAGSLVRGGRPQQRSIHGLVANDRKADGQLSHRDALPGAVLLLWRGEPPGELVATAETDVRGAYRFEGVTPGRYTIQAIRGAPSEEFEVLRGLGLDSVDLEVGEDAPRVIGTSTPDPLPRWNILETRAEHVDQTHFVFLSTATFLAGQARQGGCSVPGVHVALMRCLHFNQAAGECVRFMAGQANVVTDSAGRFSFMNLLEGIYQLTASHGGQQRKRIVELSAQGPVINADFELS